MFPSLMAEIPLVFAADARQGRPAHPQIAPHATYVEEAPMDDDIPDASPKDAPIWYSMDEAMAWAAGYNAALRDIRSRSGKPS